jgi:hypothetical protein
VFHLIIKANHFFKWFALLFGRPRGSRTPNPRFWRPILYQLSYWPIQLIKSCSRTPCWVVSTAPLSSYYSMILATTPAPTVRPPSRIAKRKPSSIAIGAINVTVMDTLSPGITISVPAGNSTAPVTSVVRK